MKGNRVRVTLSLQANAWMIRLKEVVGKHGAWSPSWGRCLWVLISPGAWAIWVWCFTCDAKATCAVLLSSTCQEIAPSFQQVKWSHCFSGSFLLKCCQQVLWSCKIQKQNGSLPFDHYSPLLSIHKELNGHRKLGCGMKREGENRKERKEDREEKEEKEEGEWRRTESEK